MLLGRWRNHFFTLRRRQTLPTAQKPRGATAGAEATPSPWAGPEGTWLGLCISPRLDIKQGPAGGEEADLGTMETQRNSPSLRRWSLLLLLLGLAMPPATAQALSYREAVLLAVDGYNQRSSDANLYRLLELDQEPQGVSWGKGLGRGLCFHQAGSHCQDLCSCWTSCQEGPSPF